MLVVGEWPVAAAHPRECGVAATARAVPGAVLVVVAAGHQQPGPIRSLHPAPQVLGHILGDAQLRQHDDGCSAGGGASDQPVDLATLPLDVSGAHGDGALLLVAGQVELGEGPVGVAGGHEGVGGDQASERVGQAVVEDEAELRGPFAGQADPPGFVQPVGQPPRGCGGRHRGHRRQVWVIQRDRIAHPRLVGAALPERLGERVAVLGVEELRQAVGDDDRGNVVHRLQRGGEGMPHLR
ncbi:hypothetical protein GCM10022380_88550 [Amycolatopsis tucumanensis]|uniref:Uncharacterized protein n=1 Tax=Amycolatopsis tucumanensis TaxID=401106 RepID=A0ABP7JXX5_9PSEU